MVDASQNPLSEKRWEGTAQPERRVALITQTSGKEVGRCFILEPEQALRAGRDPRCAIQLSEDDCSKQHIEIRYTKPEGRTAQLWVKDLGSTNGSYLELTRLGHNHSVPWGAGKTLTLSHTVQFIAAIVSFEEAEYLTWAASLPHHDPALGVLNRDGLIKVLERETSVLEKNPENQVALMIVRLIHHGSSANSSAHTPLIKSVLGALRPKLRGGSVVARSGSTELALVVRKCDVEGAHSVIRRIGESIDEFTASTGVLGRKYPDLVISMAILLFSGKYHPEPETLLNFAENELFEADNIDSNRTVREYIPRSSG